MDEQTRNEERRKSLRVNFNTNITLTTKSKSYKLNGDSRDISQKGIFISTAEDIKIDTLCEIKITLEGAMPPIILNIKGKIVRKTSDGIGIEFKEMNLDSYTHLKNIIKFNTESY